MIRALTLRLPDEVREAVRRHATHDGVTMTTWITRLIDAEHSRRTDDHTQLGATTQTSETGPNPAPRAAIREPR
ncbi:hypothetical protein [Frankia sp. AiPs1]